MDAVEAGNQNKNPTTNTTSSSSFVRLRPTMDLILSSYASGQPHPPPPITFKRPIPPSTVSVDRTVELIEGKKIEDAMNDDGEEEKTNLEARQDVGDEEDIANTDTDTNTNTADTTESVFNPHSSELKIAIEENSRVHVVTTTTRRVNQNKRKTVDSEKKLPNKNHNNNPTGRIVHPNHPPAGQKSKKTKPSSSLKSNSSNYQSKTKKHKPVVVKKANGKCSLYF